VKPPKRKRALRVYEPNSGAATSDWFVRCQRAMRELERTGFIEDAALRKRIREGWDPAVEIAVMSTRPDLPEMLEFACLKVLAERQQRTAELLTKGREPGDVKITIVVPEWASGKPSALPAPKHPDDETFTV
jgi:hypothetical protein